MASRVLLLTCRGASIFVTRVLLQHQPLSTELSILQYTKNSCASSSQFTIATTSIVHCPFPHFLHTYKPPSVLLNCNPSVQDSNYVSRYPRHTVGKHFPFSDLRLRTVTKW
jgi:hypothetical protein